jgi:Cof subfamily protein (haloacid dehalogenase superfamily)
MMSLRQGWQQDDGMAGSDRYYGCDLVAIDVDGTLLNTRWEIADDVESAINTAIAQRIHVTLVSGRNRMGLLRVINRLDLSQSYISSGGALIVDYSNGQIISHNPVPREEATVIVGLARTKSVGIFFESQDCIYAEAGLDVIERIKPLNDTNVVVVDDILQASPNDPTKVTIVGDRDVLLSIEYEIRRRNQPVHLTYSAPIYMEVTKSGVNKGTALKQLAEHLHISLERVVAIGDANNDISMFDVAGLAVAMGNAPADVKEAADLVAPTNDEGGVAWVLRRLVPYSDQGD